MARVSAVIEDLKLLKEIIFSVKECLEHMQSRLKGTPPGFEQRCNDALKLARLPQTVILVRGDTGAGNSSLINAVLGEQYLIPANTRVSTEVSYNIDGTSKFAAELEFGAEDPQIPSKIKKIEEDDWQDFGSALLLKLRSWPRVKLVRIRVKSPILSSGIVLVERSSFPDDNQARMSVVKEAERRIARLWIVLPAQMDDEERVRELMEGELGKRLMYGEDLDKVTFVCSKADEAADRGVVNQGTHGTTIQRGYAAGLRHSRDLPVLHADSWHIHRGFSTGLRRSKPLPDLTRLVPPVFHVAADDSWGLSRDASGIPELQARCLELALSKLRTTVYWLMIQMNSIINWRSRNTTWRVLPSPWPGLESRRAARLKHRVHLMESSDSTNIDNELRRRGRRLLRSLSEA